MLLSTSVAVLAMVRNLSRMLTCCDLLVWGVAPTAGTHRRCVRISLVHSRQHSIVKWQVHTMHADITSLVIEAVRQVRRTTARSSVACIRSEDIAHGVHSVLRNACDLSNAARAS